MNIYFEIAEKTLNGNIMTSYNSRNSRAEIVKWDVPVEYIPKFKPGESVVTFRAVDTTTIPSIWKGFMGAAGKGLDAITSKINNMFGSVSTQTVSVQPDYKEPFRPVPIHTGVKVIMPRDMALQIMPVHKCFTNGLVIVGGNLITYKDISNEIIVYFYNFLNTDVTLQRGDEIAVGIFNKVEGTFLPGNTDVVTQEKDIVSETIKIGKEQLRPTPIMQPQRMTQQSCQTGQPFRQNIKGISLNK